MNSAIGCNHRRDGGHFVMVGGFPGNPSVIGVDRDALARNDGPDVRSSRAYLKHEHLWESGPSFGASGFQPFNRPADVGHRDRVFLLADPRGCTGNACGWPSARPSSAVGRSVEGLERVDTLSVTCLTYGAVGIPQAGRSRRERPRPVSSGGVFFFEPEAPRREAQAEGRARNPRRRAAGIR